MIAAFTLMCLLAPAECRSSDAAQIARAIDAATEDGGLRAHLVVYSHRESHWTISPRPWSWDARAGIARGPWQLWGSAGRLGLEDQARSWLKNVQQAGLPGVDSSRRRAWQRARIAERLVRQAAEVAPPA